MTRHSPNWRDHAAAPGSTLHYATLRLAPEPKQRVLALYGIAAAITDIADHCSEPGVALAKLGWWAEELGRLDRGEGRHPLARALGQLPAAELLDCCAAVRDEIAAYGLGNRANYDRYCTAIAGIHRLAAGFIDGSAAGVGNAGATMGTALARARVLLDAGHRLHQGRTPMPRQDSRSGDDSNPTQWFRSAGAQQLVSRLTDDCLRDLEKAARAMPRSLHPLTIQARIMAAELAEIRRDGYRVLDRRVELTPLRRLWIATRTYYGSLLHST